ncbi:MAG: pyruvate kinase [Proteobacteria bacterium]|nr:pyruvate kinase [Pseudomonadota bacterium]NDC22984.1 pyruvate kinase [Pseudomonadota bacterium]NDD03309.1 pyruvate kinase [Pseudomonadota bacterium]NDG25679.1 pyruvate kinase [Pseudomonadota bacterium]
MNRKVKIICTVGPASNTPEMLDQLARAGMDIARLNFSHGNHAEFARMIGYIREMEPRIGKPIGIMADIQGPKIRVGKFKDGSVNLVNGKEALVTTEPVFGGMEGEVAIIPTGYKDFIKDVSPGHTILLDDGLIELKAVEKNNRGLRCVIVNGGILTANKGINSPESSFSARSITEKDYDDILFCIEQSVDFIAMSFVRTAQEVRHLKSFIESRGKNILVLAKIEKHESLANLDDIIDASDGILVARGDLAVEVGNERVPVIQKKIVKRCNLRGKSVIIATQMLSSMIDNPRPTRAEASDVANAIVDGTDAVMLSNETAVGKFPVETVKMMVKIIEEMEAEPPIWGITAFNEWLLPPQGQLAIALLQSAVRLASVVKAKLFVVITQSGQSALLTSKCRPANRLIAMTASKETYRQLSLKWGVEAVLIQDPRDLGSESATFDAIGRELLKLNLCQRGDRIVITAGLPILAPGSTNTIKVHQIQ